MPMSLNDEEMWRDRPILNDEATTFTPRDRNRHRKLTSTPLPVRWDC
jgi:hypothetical protein